MRLRLAAPFTVLGLVVAGCGGGQVAVQEVPGPPAQLTTPGGAALAPAATATPGVTATATPTATTTGASTGTSDGTGTTTATTQQQTSSTTTSSGSASDGGTQAPATGEATATPAPGSPTQQYEDFCAQNPGAC
jgi:hypothetical protein